MEPKNKFNYIWIIAAIVLGFFALMMFRPSTQSNKSMGELQPTPQQEQTIEPTLETTQEPTQTNTTAPSDTTITGGTMTQGTEKAFTLTASNYTYDVKEIRVKKGDTVKIILKNSDGFHDWNLDEFKVKTNVIKTGESQTVSFVADKVGTFEYYCSVGQHRAMGMKGNLIVSE